MTTGEYITEGMVIKIVNPYNPLSLPINYTVIGLQGMYVLLEAEKGARILAQLDELIVPPGRMYVRVAA